MEYGNASGFIPSSMKKNVPRVRTPPPGVAIVPFRPINVHENSGRWRLPTLYTTHVHNTCKNIEILQDPDVNPYLEERLPGESKNPRPSSLTKTSTNFTKLKNSITHKKIPKRTLDDGVQCSLVPGILTDEILRIERMTPLAFHNVCCSRSERGF